MAHHYDDRSRGEYRGGRGFDREDRNFFERAGEEVRSWFGGDDSRRRHHGEHEHGRHERMASERAWTGGERWEGPERWRGERMPNRARGESERMDYDRSTSSRGWSDPGYVQSSSSEYEFSDRWPREGSWRADRAGRDDAWEGRERTGRGDEWRWRGSGESRGIYEDAGGDVHQFTHWRAAGGHAGRGPKGYRRSDDRIREDLCDRLTEDPIIDASDMEVGVQGGEVTLSGIVHSRDEKRRAEDLAERIPGVRDVHNALRVDRWGEGGNRDQAAPTTGSPTTAAPGRTVTSR